MSITNVKLIRNALSLIKVLRVGEAAEAEHSEMGMDKLNALLADWEADGVNLQYFPQTIDDLGNDCPIPNDAELAVTYYLAFALAPHYGKQIDPAMVTLGEKYYARLTRDAVSEKLIEVRVARPASEAGSGSYDITHG